MEKIEKMELKHFNLIRELTWSDYKLRYSGTALGFLWSFLKPLLMLIVLYVIFSYVIPLKIPNYPIFLLLGVIIWNYFVESTTMNMYNLSAKSKVIKNTYFPRQILVISSCLNASISFLINILLFFIFLLFSGVVFSLIGFIIFLIILILLFILSLGTSYILSSFYPKFRDLSHIWEILMQIGFFVTPIVYNMAVIPIKYKQLYMMNPLAQILEYSRNSMLYNQIPSILQILILSVICIVIYLVGYALFKYRSKYLAEEL